MRILALLVLLAAPLVARAETNACTTIDSIPVTISTPGSYCLHSDLTSAVAVDAVMIHIAQTSDVTLDCNGHYLSGALMTDENRETVHYYGIKVGSSTRVTVRNCNVNGFRNGIIVHRFADGHARSRDIVLENNGIEESAYALYLSGEGTNRVSDNRIGRTSVRGIEVYAAPGQTVVSGNIVQITGNTSLTGEAGVFSQLGGWLIVDGNLFSDTTGPAGAGTAAAVRLDTFAGIGFQFTNNRILDDTFASPTGVAVGVSNPGGYTCSGNVIVGYGVLPANCPGPSNVAY